jgi:hypothetical protein
MNTENVQNPRLLVVSANRWPAAGQIASALVLAGFKVAALCPTDSPVYRLKKLHARFPYRSWSSSASTKFAIAAWSPDVLVVTDDVAAQVLRSLYFKASKKSSDLTSVALMDLVELSFGDRRSFVFTQSKSAVLMLAESLGIACPQTTVLTDNFEFAGKENRTVFPIMVKADDAWGGLGVQVVNDQIALQAAIAELSLPSHWPRKLKRPLARRLPSALLRLLFGWPRKISIQQLVVGRPCTCAVVCWKGKVLAGITVDVLATRYEFGPATTVKIIDHPDVTVAAERIVAKLELSGFLGFDFMLDPANKAWFLEMNSRATPICHICADNQDLAGSFFTQFTGMRPKATYCAIHQDTFTLFPYGMPWVRQMLPTLPSEIDAPDDEPEYVKACRVREGAKMRGWFRYSTKSETVREEQG